MADMGSEYVGQLVTGKAYLGARPDLQDSYFVIVGAPFDGTSSWLPGSRFAPQVIREVSEALEDYSWAQRRSLLDVPFCDLGDLELPLGDTQKVLEIIEKTADCLYEKGKVPLFLGGEHLITLPVVRAAYRRHPDLVVVHYDAHADLRQEFLGSELSHATVMARVVEELGPGRLYQLGIRSGTKEESEVAGEVSVLLEGSLPQATEKLVSLLRGRSMAETEEPSALYVSMDIDVLDPSAAPGTGTPEPAGASSEELFESIRMLADAGLRVVGWDLVEVCPPADTPARITAMAAAKLVRESLVAFAAAAGV